MTRDEPPLVEVMRDLYLAAASDPDFGVVLVRVGAATDTELADLIEADGRTRLHLNKTVTLERYLDAVPDLPRRADPLDAAIDMTLRSFAQDASIDEDAVERLCDTHPDLSVAIRDAAALSNALWPTQHVQRHAASRTIRELPCDFGPPLDDGAARYALTELLGEGAFGQVYLGVDRKLSEPGHPALVSLKLLSAEHRTAGMRRQLIDEATKARRINHPNVAQVLDRGVSGENEDFLVYEFVGGGDLARWARQYEPRVPISDAVRMVARIARGVHAAHMAGLVHCDLKPGNVLLTSDGEPKVTDFGVAIRSGEGDRSRTAGAVSAQIGNLAFMSPEQYRIDDGALTIPTDVYAVGGLLFWLLTGRLPNGSTADEIRENHDPVSGRTSPPDTRSLREDVDRDLAAICERAMAIQPGDRFNSAAEVADSLEAWLRREPIPWTRPAIAHRVALWIRRRPVGAAAGVVILVLLIGIGVALVNMAMTQVKLEAEEAERIEFTGNLRSMVARLKKARDEGLDHDVLPQIWLLEWVFDPKVYGEGEHLADLRAVRTQVVGDLIEEAKARGGERAFQTLLWESALAFWLIRDERYPEADTLLAANYDKWAAILEAGDPWLLQLRAMQGCVAAGLGTAQLEETVSVLEQAEAMLSADERGSGMHRLVLAHLQRVYGPERLDRPERLVEIDEALREATE